jgi:hypothetical protein
MGNSGQGAKKSVPEGTPKFKTKPVKDLLRFVRKFLEGVGKKLLAYGGRIKEAFKLRPGQLPAAEQHHNGRHREAEEQAEHHIFFHRSPERKMNALD